MAVYRIYIDESGDHIYGEGIIKYPEPKIGWIREEYPHLEKGGNRYLALTGCIIEKEYYLEYFHPAIEELKRVHFGYDPDEKPVILHRKDIYEHTGAFWRLRDVARENAFNGDLLRLLNTLDYRLITIVIDKERHKQKYGVEAFHPYYYCLAAILERYCYFLQNLSATGDVVAESRNRVPDEELKKAYVEIWETGTNVKRDINFFRTRLTSKEIKIKPKKENIAGLQLADMLAMPSKKDVLLENKRITIDNIDNNERGVIEMIQKKYHCNSFTSKIMKFGRYLI